MHMIDLRHLNNQLEFFTDIEAQSASSEPAQWRSFSKSEGVSSLFARVAHICSPSSVNSKEQLSYPKHIKKSLFVLHLYLPHLSWPLDQSMLQLICQCAVQSILSPDS